MKNYVHPWNFKRRYQINIRLGILTILQVDLVMLLYYCFFMNGALKLKNQESDQNIFCGKLLFKFNIV